MAKTSLDLSEKLLTEICKIDINLYEVTKEEPIKYSIINNLNERFKVIAESYGFLADDLINRVVNYHKNTTDKDITDFIHLIEWFSMYLPEKSLDYWDVDGEYYSLRMSEIISFYLIAKHQGIAKD